MSDPTKREYLDSDIAVRLWQDYLSDGGYEVRAPIPAQESNPVVDFVRFMGRVVRWLIHG
jgi:hypothetical protein